MRGGGGGEKKQTRRRILQSKRAFPLQRRGFKKKSSFWCWCSGRGESQRKKIHVAILSIAETFFWGLHNEQGKT